MRAEPGETRVTLRLALDPNHWRAHDRALWTHDLVYVADSGAPNILRVEGFEMGDVILRVRMFSGETPKRLKKLLRDDDAVIRMRARLADLGARAEFEIEEVESA